MDVPVEFTLDTGRRIAIRPSDVILVEEVGRRMTRLHIRDPRHHDYRVRQDYDEVKRRLGWP